MKRKQRTAAPCDCTNRLLAFGRRRRRGEAGFTLAEVMVASAIFTIIMGSIIALNLFSARVTSGIGRLLELSAQSNVLNLMVNDIKSSQQSSVQNYDGTAFTAIPLGQPQQGNALSVSIQNGTNTQQVYYYVNSAGQLYRWDASANITRKYLTDITNTVAFSSQTYSGSVISNQIARTLIDINLLVVDSNPRDFRQTLTLRASAEKRN